MANHSAAPGERNGGLPTPLPVELAFVVQFGAGTGPIDPITAGRIEHIVSGRQRRFTNSEELLVALREMLPPPQREKEDQR